jgi:hypothetical protein
MFVITRHRPPDIAEFKTQAHLLAELLSKELGFIDFQIGGSPDAPETLVIVQNWDLLGNARRALNSSKNRLIVWPVLSTALDEPTFFESLYEYKNGESQEFESVLNLNERER